MHVTTQEYACGQIWTSFLLKFYIQSILETIDHCAMAMFIKCIEVHGILINQHAQRRIHERCFGNKTTLVASPNGVSNNCFPNVRHLGSNCFVDGERVILRYNLLPFLLIVLIFFLIFYVFGWISTYLHIMWHNLRLVLGSKITSVSNHPITNQ